MPINPNALSSPEPNEQPPSEAAAAALAGVTNENEDPAQPAKKQRRTKAQMIADAVIPDATDTVEVKDANTGAKVQRAWSEAVALVESGAAEFVDKTLKYAVQKMQQQQAAPAFQEAQPQLVERHDDAATGNVPPDASPGDEVRIGAETFRVGHGGVLTNSPVTDADGNVVKGKRLWQRELGSGVNGPWQSVALTHTDPQRPLFDKDPAQIEAGAFSDPSPATNGKVEEDVVEQAVRTGQPVVQTQQLPHTTEEVGPGLIKIGTGMLDKIGLPDFSSLQVGPITMSRTIVDDGRRTKTMVHGRDVTVISVAVEAFEEMDNTIEFIGARFRGQLQSFLQATGAITQPVS